MKKYLAKLALKLFKNEYKLLITKINISHKEYKTLEMNIPEVVMNDDEWHDYTIKFWAKSNKKELIIDSIGLWDKDVVSYQVK
jgi:hypothetical protein